MNLEFTVNRVEYKVPEYIDIETFEKAIVWNLDDLQNLKPFVATIVGCPLSVIDKLDEEVLAFITGTCLQKIQVHESPLEHVIGNYNLVSLESISFGEWIDLDTYMSIGPGENLSKIVRILYGIPQDRIADPLHWDANLVWGAVKDLAEWRGQVYKEYDEFFDLGQGEDKSPNAEEDQEEANIQLMWWECCMALADGDFLKIHQVVERPWREALNFLTWKKAQVQKEKLQNLKRKNDIQRRTR